MTIQCTFIQNKWADLPNEVEPIQSKSKQGYQTLLGKTGGKMMNKE
jgi:hypothetical protein